MARYLCLLVAVAFGASAYAGPTSVAKYQQWLRESVKNLSEPMLKLLSRERAEALRHTVPYCRDQKPFKACLAEGAEADCDLAARCPFLDKSDQSLIAPNQKLMRDRYADLQEKFDAKLKGHRRGFAIGTLNRLVGRFNDAMAASTAVSSNSALSLANDCNKDNDSVANPKTVQCMYDRLQAAFSKTAHEIEERRADFERFVEKDLADRIAGFKDKPIIDSKTGKPIPEK